MPPDTEATGVDEKRVSEGVLRLRKLKETGNEAFRHSKFEEAIDIFSSSLRLARNLMEEGQNEAAEEEVLLYSNRSAAYSSLSRQYLTRPASRSESSALMGIDPGHLARLALADAQKVVAAKPNWAKGFSRLGAAYMLSERFLDAETAYMQGLQIEPTSKALQEGLQEVTRMLEGNPVLDPEKTKEEAVSEKLQSGPSGRALSSKRLRPCTAGGTTASTEDLECTLCLKLLYEPVTTPCGHSFCRNCLVRALDHTPRCPICRTMVHSSPRELPISVTLAAVCQKVFSQEYKEREEEEAAQSKHQKEEASAASVIGGAGTILPALPLFVMSTILPGERMSLNIFEPRYRLMLRRAMEGSRRIGMAQVRRRDRSLDEIAVEAEVIECTTQPDGRYSIEVVGRRRVKVLEGSEVDGYRVVRAMVIEDTGPVLDSVEMLALPGLCTEIAEQVDSMLARLRTWATGSGVGPRQARMIQYLEQCGPRPQVEKREAFSFWAGSLVVAFLPELTFDDRTRLLHMRNTHERLTFIKTSLDAAKTARGEEGSSGCCVM